MSERTEEALKERVRKTPLVERLQDCAKRIGAMCAEGHGPRMSIPPEHFDDDFYICVTVDDAKDRIAHLERLITEDDNARKNAQAVSSDLVNKKRALEDEVAQLTAMRAVHRDSYEECRGEIVSLKSQLSQRMRDLEEVCQTEVELREELSKLRSLETIASVTDWANKTFGEATIEAQYKRANKEWDELTAAIELDLPAEKVAIEAADVCICLFRIIGTLNPQAINLKMAKNRARKWALDGNGCAQHVE